MIITLTPTHMHILYYKTQASILTHTNPHTPARATVYFPPSFLVPLKLKLNHTHTHTHTHDPVFFRPSPPTHSRTHAHIWTFPLSNIHRLLKITVTDTHLFISTLTFAPFIHTYPHAHTPTYMHTHMHAYTSTHTHTLSFITCFCLFLARIRTHTHTQ